MLDELFDKQSGELDRKKRYALLREFEKRALEQAYTVPTIWWHRIIVHHKQLKGWHITPSHYVGQDLADVWLERTERSDVRGGRSARPCNGPSTDARYIVNRFLLMIPTLLGVAVLVFFLLRLMPGDSSSCS